MAGGSRHGVRPGGGSADNTEAATDGGSDDGGVAQLLQEDCPVKHSARWDVVNIYSLGRVFSQEFFNLASFFFINS